jgi:hypothetical protein
MKIQEIENLKLKHLKQKLASSIVYFENQSADPSPQRKNLDPEQIKPNTTMQSSVADSDPNPDPPVFGPPGSGSTSQRYGSGSRSCSGSGSFYHHPKIVKNLDFYYFVTLSDFLSLKIDVNVASKSNKQKKLCKKISFLLASEGQ